MILDHDPNTEALEWTVQHAVLLCQVRLGDNSIVRKDSAGHRAAR